MKNVPGFYYKNAAAGAARRVVNCKKAAPDTMRETVGQVVSWCILIALAGFQGWNHDEMEAFAEEVSRFTETYCLKVREVGGTKADRWLNGKTKPVHFMLPADKPIKKQADRDELAQKRMAAETAWKLMAATMMNTDKESIKMDSLAVQHVLDDAKSVYRDRFLDWAKEGDAYGMERLKMDVETMLGEQVEVVDDGRGAVFSERLY